MAKINKFNKLSLLQIYQDSLETRNYYRKESAASPPRDQRQHAQFDE
jgi:hypothetical protein